MKRMFTGLALWLPLLGPAYFRACEITCDRYGIYTADAKEGAVRAMMVLSGGKHVGKLMSPHAFAEQYRKKRGFFVSWHELASSYPTLSRRVAYLLSIKEGVEFRKPSYHPLAYVFALFTIGGGFGFTGVFMIIVVLAMLAAIAIPNFVRARTNANEALAKNALRVMSDAAEAYAVSNNGRYPENPEELLRRSRPHINKNFCGEVVSGFIYDCEMSSSGYEYTAVPVERGRTGISVFSVKTGGEVVSFP